MDSKLKILVLVENNFNDIELTSTLSVLKAADVVEQITYFSPEIYQAQGQFGITQLNDVEQMVVFDQYDAIFIPGGRGAQTLRKDKISLQIVKYFYNSNKYVFAICDAPNVLMEAKILKSECTYSSYPSEWSLSTRGANRSNEMTSVDGKLITGKNAFAAPLLGLRIIKELYGEELEQATYLRINGD
ncbi:DJ-1/PfpI family protein [Mycoplasma seminis]|uniref:DJ-1/PfpI family protein n=1 Tax=Mycoplasma seminis TaxID=512749 RepID=A0ABY9HBF1_9MOLU|nr:DJ-1/PfpI family protein [Mycoplasma seminis]WLP85576.1 DJ-1/PfpI family protein [Mycoplasma seminis]